MNQKPTTRTQALNQTLSILPFYLSCFQEEQMAAIETSAKSSLHTRCNSFPTASHPLVSKFEEHLQRLKGSETTSSLSTASSVSLKLDGLQDLQDCIDKMLKLPIEQQALAQECNDRRVEELFEGSLMLLDICSKAKDCLMQSKETVEELQSAMRRKRTDETGFIIGAEKYLSSRKTAKKAIRKALENLRTMKNKENSTSQMLSYLKEAEEITLSSLEQVLMFISDPKGQSEKRTWPVIYKLMQPKRVTCCQESEINEFGKVDEALQSLIKGKPSTIENFQINVENLVMCILDLEKGIEQLSRKLIRNRVSLLNIFNH